MSPSVHHFDRTPAHPEGGDAILLITHGSPDIRAQRAAQDLTQQVQQAIAPGHSLRVGAPIPLVGLAYLEQGETPLYEQICQFGAVVTQAGYNRLQLFPLFLLPGVHVVEDIPAALRQAQAVLGKDVMLELRPYLGAYSGLIHWLQTQRVGTVGLPQILLAHGSRLPGAQQQVAAVAQALPAIPAYLTGNPTLADGLQTLASGGKGPVHILPYALFEGRMTAAIATLINQLAPHFPDLHLHQEPALGADPTFAHLIADLLMAPPELGARS